MNVRYFLAKERGLTCGQPKGASPSLIAELSVPELKMCLSSLNTKLKLAILLNTI